VSLALFKLRYLEQNRMLMRGLHTREELQLCGTVRLGEPLTLRARISDKFTKRGERFIVVSGQVNDGRGRPILRSKQTQLLRDGVGLIAGRQTAEPPEQVVRGAIADRARLASVTPGGEIGAILPALTKQVTFEQMTIFSFGPRTIHTDRDVAIASGLGGPIAQGLMSTCYLSEMLRNFFGAAWFESGWTSHAFIKPVAAGDTLTVHGRICDRQVEAGGTRVLLDVWCRNQKEELTTVGNASALVRS
jgi:acyl dehydratase